MVILAAQIKIKEEFKSRFLRAGYAMLPLSRRELGCLHYHFYTDVHDDFGFLFYEKWASREALDAHFATDHFKTFIEIVEAMLREPMVVETFDVVEPAAAAAPVTEVLDSA